MFIRLLFVSLLAIMGNLTAQETLKAPVAKLVPKKITMHGETRTDDYFWLRDKENPETIRYLEKETGQPELVHYRSFGDGLSPCVSTAIASGCQSIRL